MAKITIAKLFKAYREANRLQLVHHGDDAGRIASECSSVISSFLRGCQAEVEINIGVEKALRDIQSIS